MFGKSDNADERRAQVEPVLQRADRQDPERRNRGRRKTERRAAKSPKKR